MLKVGLVGCGGIGKAHAACYAALGTMVQVVAVADVDAEKARDAAHRFGAGIYACGKCNVDRSSTTPPFIKVFWVCLERQRRQMGESMKEYKRFTKRTDLGCAYCEEPLFYSINRLAELEDKIEPGTLIELPCKVGDMLYYVDKYRPTPRIEENIVHTIEMFEARDGFNIRIWTQNGTFYANKMPNVFLTKAEAEQKLKELKGEI